MKYYILAFFIYELLFGSYFYKNYIDTKEEYYATTIKLSHNSLKNSIYSFEVIYDDFYARQSDTIAKFVNMANNASMEKRDIVRDKLLNNFMTFFNYEKLNSLNGFHIFDKDGRSLLRFHKPLKHEDMIINKRYSLQELKKNMFYQSGFEIGVFQESYRFQYPLFYDGNYVGSYEYSVNPTALMKSMVSFYGKSYQVLFKKDVMDAKVIKPMLQKHYTELDFPSLKVYIKKYSHVKELQKEKLDFLISLKSLQERLKQEKNSIIEYKYQADYSSLCVLPIKDIEGKCFGWILVDVGSSPTHGYFKSFILKFLLSSLFGIVLFMYVYREIKTRWYLEELINLQHDLIVVTDGKNIEQVNRAFLEFFGFETLKSFKKEHSCVCDMFIESEEYIQAEYDDIHWIEYLKNDLQKIHKVGMLSLSNEERTFELKMEFIKNSNKAFILFRDITQEIKAKEKLEERANIDSLTHLYNRERFEHFLKLEISRTERNQKSFSLIMFDIDHFKNINDSYGHDVGDIVLKELSALVSSQTREIDILARWGGEEFMIIAQNCIYESEKFAEKLRSSLEHHKFEKVGSVTCSFGVTQYRKGDDPQSIVKRADKMLYSAKESGRNCVASLK